MCVWSDSTGPRLDVNNACGKLPWEARRVFHIDNTLLRRSSLESYSTHSKQQGMFGYLTSLPAVHLKLTASHLGNPLITFEITSTSTFEASALILKTFSDILVVSSHLLHTHCGWLDIHRTLTNKRRPLIQFKMAAQTPADQLLYNPANRCALTLLHPSVYSPNHTLAEHTMRGRSTTSSPVRPFC